MFFDKLKKLCDDRGISTYKACTDVGLNRAAVAKWKNGSIPSGNTAAKLAVYFGVTTDYLLGKDEKEKPLINGDEELTEYVEMLKNRPECRMLFQLSKNATKEDVEAAVRIIEALRK